MIRYACCLTVFAAAATASGSLVTWSMAQDSLSASAQFDISGTDLIITLTNTSGFDALATSDILTGVYFSLSGPSTSLTAASAVMPADSIVLFGSTHAGGVVGGEWAFRSDLPGLPFGISAAGAGLFSTSDRFPGPNLDGRAALGGLNFGITSAGDNPATGPAALTGDEPLIRNQVVFRLSGLPTGFDAAASVTAVSFQYGDAIPTPTFAAVPEQGGVAVLGLASLSAGRRRRR